MTPAWHEFQRGTALINRTKNYGRAHPNAAEKDTLNALGEPATKDNLLYARAGLFQAAQEREAAARGEPTQAPLGGRAQTKEDAMRDINPGELTWFKSSFSAAGACVEVAHLPNGAGIALRDSKDRSRPPHFFTSDEWAAFVAGVKAGEFDVPELT